MAGLPVNDKIKTLENDYMKAKDEILTLLRERGDVCFEIFSFFVHSFTYHYFIR